jgi:dihydrofolate reductase
LTQVTCDMAISVDGFVAGPNRSPDEPFGEGVDGRLHHWIFEEAAAHADESAAMTAAGAYVLGRNMFGPGRRAWDHEWKGWCGDEPPFHAPVFVLTHHDRRPSRWKQAPGSTSSPMAAGQRSTGTRGGERARRRNRQRRRRATVGRHIVLRSP